MRRTMALAGGLALAMAALATVPLEAAAQDAAAGAAIFTGKGACFACHGPAGKGTALGPDLTDAEWINFETRPTQAALEALVKAGVPKPVRHTGPMPPMGGARLSAEEVARVAAYVLSLSEG